MLTNTFAKEAQATLPSHFKHIFWNDSALNITSSFGQSCYLSLLRCVYLPIDIDTRLLQPTLTFYQTKMKILEEIILKKKSLWILHCLPAFVQNFKRFPFHIQCGPDLNDGRFFVDFHGFLRSPCLFYLLAISPKKQVQG